MKRWLPFPLIFAGLLAMWLLLNQPISVGDVLLGVLLAWVGSRLVMAPRSEGISRWRLKRAGAALRLFFVVLSDIVRSNGAVALIVVGWPRRRRSSGFIDIPIDLRNRFGLATLACIVTSTPGTLWVAFDPAQSVLTLHILDLVDENTWIKVIKGRYERLLLEIFE